MAGPLGWFDQTAVASAGFDPTTQAAGWFDPDAVDSAGGAGGISGATIASGTTLFAGKAAERVVGSTRASTLTIFAGTVAERVVGGTRASTAQLFAGTVRYTVVGAFRASTLTLFAGKAAERVVGSTRASTLQLFAGAVKYRIGGSTRSSTTTLFAGSTKQNILGGTRASTLLLYAASLALIVAGGTRASATTLFAGSIAQRLVGSTITSGSVLRTSSIKLKVVGAMIGSGAVADNFNRADESPIGGNWTSEVVSSPPLPAPWGQSELSGNKVRGLGSFSNPVWWNTVIGTSSNGSLADCFVEAKVYGMPWPGVFVRLQPGAGTAYFFMWPNNHEATLYRFVGGSSFVALLDFDMSSDLLVDGDTLRLEVEGTGATVHLRLYKNGALINSYDDTDASRIVSAGKLGLHTDGINQAILDDFKGGPLVPTGTATLYPGTLSFAGSGVVGATISGTTLFPGSTRLNVSGAFRTSTLSLFAGKAAERIAGGTISTSTALYAGSLRLKVVGGTRATTTVLFSGSVLPVQHITGATRASTTTLFAGVTSERVIGGSITSTVSLYPGTVDTGLPLSGIVGAHIASTWWVPWNGPRPPNWRLDFIVLGSFVPSGSILFSGRSVVGRGPQADASRSVLVVFERRQVAIQSEGRSVLVPKGRS